MELPLTHEFRRRGQYANIGDWPIKQYHPRAEAAWNPVRHLVNHEKYSSIALLAVLTETLPSVTIKMFYWIPAQRTMQ